MKFRIIIIQLMLELMDKLTGQPMVIGSNPRANVWGQATPHPPRSLLGSAKPSWTSSVRTQTVHPEWAQIKHGHEGLVQLRVLLGLSPALSLFHDLMEENDLG